MYQLKRLEQKVLLTWRHLRSSTAMPYLHMTSLEEQYSHAISSHDVTCRAVQPCYILTWRHLQGSTAILYLHMMSLAGRTAMLYLHMTLLAGQYSHAISSHDVTCRVVQPCYIFTWRHMQGSTAMLYPHSITFSVFRQIISYLWREVNSHTRVYTCFNLYALRNIYL